MTNVEWAVRSKELERLILPTAINFGSAESKYVMEYKFIHQDKRRDDHYISIE